MRAVSAARAAPSVERTPQSGSEIGIAPQTGNEPEKWLRNACRALLGKEAGLHLHLLTEFSESACYRYASGEREAPAEFLRKLFASSHGEQFFLAFMEQCPAQWWTEFKKQRDVGRRVVEIATEGR